MESSLYISCVSLSCGGAERVLSVLSSHFADKYENVKNIYLERNTCFL